MTNGLSQSYHLDESTFISRGVGRNFSFLFHFSMKFMKENRMAPDTASHLGLYCLPMSHKKDARLIWVNFGSGILRSTAYQFNDSIVKNCITA